MAKPYATDFTSDSYIEAIDVLGKQKDLKADDVISQQNVEPPAIEEDGHAVYDRNRFPKPFDQQVLRKQLQE